jgi:hypothetical protein
VEDFVLEWWHEDWADTLFEWYDQSTLRRMVGGESAGSQGESPPLFPSLDYHAHIGRTYS